ncbi:MAG: Pyrroline-5-carboxylate reductase, partial [Cyanobacteriota bacterium]
MALPSTTPAAGAPPLSGLGGFSPESFGVVGFGRMAQALLLPLIDSGQVPATAVRAVVGTVASAVRLEAQYGLAVATDPTGAWQAPVVLLAVKPQLLAAAAEATPAEAAPGRVPGGAGAVGGERPLLISVLAGVTLARLQALFPGHRIVRAVPN